MSLPARSEELSHPTQDVLLRSQFSSGHSAHEPTSSVRRAQPLNSGRVTQESVQFRPLGSRAYQIGQKSSATQLRTCYSGVSSAQTFNPLGLNARSPAAQNDELNHSTQAMQPRSQFSYGHSAHEPTSSVRRAQPPNSGRVTQKSVQLEQ